MFKFITFVIIIIIGTMIGITSAYYLDKHLFPKLDKQCEQIIP